MSKNSKRKARRQRQAEAGKQVPEKRKHSQKLQLWQERLVQSDREWGQLVTKMDHREQLYRGEEKLKPMIEGDKPNDATPHVRNIIFENIESLVSTSIPQPKVEPIHSKDEHLAVIIEKFLRNELKRIPFAMLNDMGERTTPIQGGLVWMVEWDENHRTHNTIGADKVSIVHPKQLAPQPGIYTGFDDMDWIIVKQPTTKTAVRRRYGVEVHSESEAEPEIRGLEGGGDNDEALTQYIGFEINDSGSIDKYVWLNDIELEDIENYQARRQPVCAHCGRVRPLTGQIISAGIELEEEEDTEAADQQIAGQMMARQLAAMVMEPEQTEGTFLEGAQPTREAEPRKYDGGECPWCGGNDWQTQQMEYEQIIVPIETALGKQIPGEHLAVDEEGNAVMVPTMVPFYRPDCYPLILQRNVSNFGQLLGSSDVDVIEDQQNTINRLEKKVIDRILKAGTRVVLPVDGKFRIDQKDYEKWYVPNQAVKNQIGVYEFRGDLQYELAYLAQVYEEARQILGITDSFQGRKDTTATSGKAKEFSAAQASGRQESKRVNKQAAYERLFEMMFKNQLAYADEPRPVTYKDKDGHPVYEEFNRYDFLERDEDGNWYWNTDFLFSCDTSAPLANNREAMWQETRMNLETGAFGNPQATETLVLFWGKMELLHYPGAGETKKLLEERLDREQKQQMQMMQIQMIHQNRGMNPAMNQVAATMGGGYTNNL